MLIKRAGTSLISLLLAGLLSSIAFAADSPPAPSAPQAKEAIYGSQLMSPEERRAHRRAMRSFKTEEEREAYRAEHHRQMQERAKERGVTLPEAPPPRGMGMGPGPGQGMGPGQGPGMGPGMGRGMGPGGPNR